MLDKTDEFSFILKPSEHGVGVFAAHDIKQGTYLRMFGDEKEGENKSRILDKRDVPQAFIGYCVFLQDNKLMGPQDFGAMPVGHYMNHSLTPNAVHKNFNFYAARDIKAGEEILIDYKTLEEPESAREAFY